MSRDAKELVAIFVDDGAPDAFEFNNNYVWFDPSDPSDQQRAWNEATRLWMTRKARFNREGKSDTLSRPQLCASPRLQ